MLRLAAFADEISPDLDTQIEHCRNNGVTHFELRGVAGKNVLDFDAALRAEIKRKLADAGMGVISIGSHIGKVKLSEPQGICEQIAGSLKAGALNIHGVKGRRNTRPQVNIEPARKIVPASLVESKKTAKQTGVRMRCGQYKNGAVREKPATIDR